jgi:hypothetical protein
MTRALLRRAGWAIASFLLPAVASQSSAACESLVRVTFVEDSPDYFLVELLPSAPGPMKSLIIDLNTSAGGAYVDSAHGPERVGKAEMTVETMEGLVSGSQSWRFAFSDYEPGSAMRILVDLDDTGGLQGDFDQDHLTSAEIAGATSEALIQGEDGHEVTVSGQFDYQGVAQLGGQACV